MCHEFIEKIMKKVGDEITAKELEYLLLPCSTYLSIHAAEMVAMHAVIKPNKQDELDKNTVEDMFDEGAEEPSIPDKDRF